MPLPAPFLAGFDAQRADSEGGEFPSFLNGEWSSSGWKYYYLAAFGMKETLPFLVLLLIGAVLAVGDRMKRPRISFEDLVFWWVPIALIVVLSFFNRLDVGIRYLLPAYPFLWVFCGGVAASLLKKNWGRVCLGILLAWAIAEPFRAAPHYMAYFNETAGGPRNGYLHLIDSNLDHGQDLRALKNYLDENGIKKIQLAYFGHVWPQLYGIDFEPLGETPKPGVVAISASFLEGQPYLLTYTAQPMVVPLNYYQAMRRYRPVAQIGYSIFVYKIPA